VERERPEFESLKKKVTSILPKSEFTAYDIMKKLDGKKEIKKSEWDKKYVLVCKILNEMEMKGKLRSRLEHIKGKTMFKRLYKMVK